MLLPKGRLIVIGVTLCILAVILFAGWLLLSTGQVAANFFVVSKSLVSAPIELENSYRNAKDGFSFRYPRDWSLQSSDDGAKMSVAAARRLLQSDARLPFVELDRLMVGSWRYPLKCQATDISLETCAGQTLPTGAFLDLYTMYYREVSIEDIMATATTTWADPETIDESPIKLAGRKLYEWKGLQCGAKCFVLRTLIIPLGDHRTLQLFANVYINEPLNQQDLANTLRSYQEQLDAVIASLTWE